MVPLQYFRILITVLCLLEQVCCQECGVQKPQSNDGTQVPEQGAWPWMVSVFRNWGDKMEPLCSGFLIDKTHVLSAAHCFGNEDTSVYVAKIGDVNSTQGQEYGILRIDVQDGYEPGQFYNDIALLTLSREVTEPNTGAICLPSGHEFRNLTGIKATSTGWGPTESGDGKRTILLELQENVITNYRCNQILNEKFPTFHLQFPKGIDDGLMCSMPLESIEGRCADSGGPLMFQQENRWYVVGIGSFGYRCGVPGYPEGYTRVTEFLNWIEEVKYKHQE